MKKIAVCALKGGVGKSSVVAGLGLALVIKKFKVGFLDIDITGSNLFSALGLAHSPKWELDSLNEKVVVPEVNGFWLLSIASYVGEDYAVLWEGSHHQELTDARDRLSQLGNGATVEDLEVVRRKIDDVLASSKWRFVSELLSDEIVTWPEPLDFLIADLPPSCLTGDTLIFTPTGPMPITEIRKWDKVYSFQGKLWREKRENRRSLWHFDASIVEDRVLNIIPQGLDEVYEVRTAGRKIKANSKHPFLCINRERQTKGGIIKGGRKGKYNYDLIWKPLSELTTDDVIIIAKALPDIDDNFLDLPPELCRVAGFFLGDGHIQRDTRYNHPATAVALSEPPAGKYRTQYIKLLTEMGFVPHEYDNGLVVCSAPLAKLLCSLGLDKKCLEKEVPAWVFSLPKGHKEAILEGFIDADGHRRRGNSTLTSANEKMLKQLHALSVYCGFRPTNITKANSTSIIDNRVVSGDGYSFELIKPKGSHPRGSLGTHLVRFRTNGRENPGLEHPYFGAERILSIKPCGREIVYDLVTRETGNFIANGMVVHNTSNEMFSFFDQVKDLSGVIIVSQPAKMSTIGLLRTIDLLRQKQIPIIGLVANQDGFLNRHGENEYQFLSPRVDLQRVAREAGIPFLVSIPQCGDGDKLKPYFSELAERVVDSRPVVLKEVTMGRKLKRKVVKGIARRI